MPRFTRRDCVRGTAGLLAARAAAPSAAAHPTGKGPGIKFCEIYNPGETSRLKLAKQMGVNYAISGVSGALSRARREDYVSVLQKIKDEYAAQGIQIAGVESHPVPAEKIKLGLPGRDEEIENYKEAIVALKKIGVPMICYNFMAGLGWYRTNTKKEGRGGAFTSEFDNSVALKQGLTQWGEVSEEKVWANIEYFLKAVIPVADKVGMQMALHPDDPPLSPLRGIGRILISARNYERVMDTVPSKMNGVTFCQANFVAMKEDIYSLARKWCQRKKVFFVHFRDIEGDATHLTETFHDNGPTNMAKMLKIYAENGFAGPMRPDHAPTMEGEQNDRPGYAMTGKVFAFGYMKGVMDGLGYPYE
ncbi:MAG: mannonate dehydratase [Acidobacteria bacterium]|nr:mannonate dehydratase [Acidobacteriota bacterium]